MRKGGGYRFTAASRAETREFILPKFCLQFALKCILQRHMRETHAEEKEFKVGFMSDESAFAHEHEDLN